MTLHELRRARALTLRELAEEMLNMNQPSATKLEQRADEYISSLSSYTGLATDKLDCRAIPAHLLLWLAQDDRLTAPTGVRQ